MKRSEYRQFIYHEVYKDQKMNIMARLIARYVTPSTNAVFIIRKYQYWLSGRYLKKLAFIYRIKLVRKYGVFITPTTKIESGLSLPHPDGIIFGASCKVGSDCTIYQQVTIGSARVGESRLGRQPDIGKNCYLFSGAKVLGNITLADNTVVAANAVLSKDTLPDSVYGGVPARLIGNSQNVFVEER